jgi:triple functional domain protein
MKPIDDQATALASNQQSTAIASTEEQRITSNKINKDLSLKSLEENQAADMAEIEQLVKERIQKHEDLKYLDSDTNALDNPLEKSTTPISPQISENENTDDAAGEEQGIDEILKKRGYALRELVQTEDAYVNDLAQIVNG